eukprot:jgi/Chlat1/2876/Chrsp195S03019
MVQQEGGFPTVGLAAKDSSGTVSDYKFSRRQLRDEDVRVQILYCGICHSDIHTIKAEWGDVEYPIVPGHEIIGQVVDVGANVKEFTKDQIVGVGVYVDSCRDCDNCHRHLSQYCENGMTGTYNSKDRSTGEVNQGGYSTQIVVDKNYVLRIPEGLHSKLAPSAPLLCAGITVFSPLKHWKLQEGERLGVIGLGGLGHMAVKFGVAFGANVTVISSSPNKKEEALSKLGAHNFLVSKDEEAMKAAANSLDFIINTVSAPHDINQYIPLMKTDGRFICVGLPPKPYELSAGALIRKRLTLGGSLIGSVQEVQEMLDFCGEHGVVADIELVEPSYVNKALERMEANDVRYRFVIDTSKFSN